MRKKLIVANWKSNKNPSQAANWLDNLILGTKDLNLNADNFEVVICPPYIDLPILNSELKIKNFQAQPDPALRGKFKISLGAQDVSPFAEGSYTGAVAANQIKELVSYCLVGHSERRKNFSETTPLVAQKIDSLLKEKIKPIVCAQSSDEIPDNIKNYLPDDVVVMFEPAKAISVGGVYKAEDPMEVEKIIVEWKKNIGPYQMLYGGSVNSSNVVSLFSAQAEGFVIGHASLETQSFIEILQNV